MKTLSMQVKKTENGKHVLVGEVGIVVPTVEDFVAQLVAAKITGEEDGLPVYDNDVANWVMSSVFNSVKMAARNKLVTGTAQVKDGLKIATNWDELTAEAERGGGAAALQLLRVLREAFATYMRGLGKSEAAQYNANKLFGSKVALEMTSPENKAKLKSYVEAFAETLSAEDLDRFERPLDSILASCEAGEASDW